MSQFRGRFFLERRLKTDCITAEQLRCPILKDLPTAADRCVLQQVDPSRAKPSQDSLPFGDKLLFQRDNGGGECLMPTLLNVSVRLGKNAKHPLLYIKVKACVKAAEHFLPNSKKNTGHDWNVTH